ncbi:MAG: MGMT family protein [Candidatus Micrarchaeia archaeon]|jgi:O-6-methylguanine DNA methyltransferase
MKFTGKQREALAKLTSFQQKVLMACAKIPKGKTMTYGELARAIGRPCAARAVGGALAINPLAPLIPCHRVVRADGGLGGYSAKGGRARKLLLLKKEMGKHVRSI